MAETGEWHRLSAVDEATRSAVCSICGPVQIRVRKGRRGNQCGTLRQRDRERRDRQDPEWRLKRHGLSRSERLAFLAADGGRCAICRTAKATVVDHDHACCAGKMGCERCIRGPLCVSCNVGLGGFADDPARLQAAIDYLASHS